MFDNTGNLPSWNDIKNGIKKAANWANDNVFTPIKKAGNVVKNTFGVGTILSNTYKSFSLETLLGGAETGSATTGTTSGDVSKPISAFFETTSDWWQITDYKVGVQDNIGDGGFCYASGIGEYSCTFSFGNQATIEFISGINKIGLTTYAGADFGNRTAGGYAHMYIRPIPIVGIYLYSLIPGLAFA